MQANTATAPRRGLHKAESLPEGREREACLALAESYVKPAELLEAHQGTSIVSP
jgi:hypothetical protein